MDDAIGHRLRRRAGKVRELLPLWRQYRPVCDWPEADRQAWDRARAPGSLFEPGGKAAGWAGSTQDSIARTWGLFLNILQLHGELRPHETGGERLTEPRFDLFIRSMQGRLSANSIHGTVRRVATAAAAMSPGHVFSWVLQHPLCPSKAEALASRRPKAVISPVRLLAAAMAAMEEAHRDEPSLIASRAYRSAMLCAFHCLVPVRKNNVPQMRIGQHLSETSDGGYLVSFSVAEMKNRKPLVRPLPDVLVPFMRAYLDVHRLRLPRSAGHDHVWVNLRGEPLEYEGIACIFRATGRKLAGQPLGANLYRRSLVTRLTAADPRLRRLGADLLGHDSVETTLMHYDLADGEAAFRIAHANLEAIQRSGRMPDENG